MNKIFTSLFLTLVTASCATIDTYAPPKGADIAYLSIPKSYFKQKVFSYEMISIFIYDLDKKGCFGTPYKLDEDRDPAEPIQVAAHKDIVFRIGYIKSGPIIDKSCGFDIGAQFEKNRRYILDFEISEEVCAVRIFREEDMKRVETFEIKGDCKVES